MSTFGERVIAFNSSLHFEGALPAGVDIMNPFLASECARQASSEFYEKYYADNNRRGILLGINPGRFGAGITGVPFSDPIRLAEFCRIKPPACPTAREPSSEFVYAVINAWGGPESFYRSWYINSVCPLGFVRLTSKGKWVNYNYYDTKELESAALPFILKTLPEQIALGIKTEICFCLGTGKNAAFLEKLNKKHHFFGNIFPLEHPRYIMQYKSGEKEKYISKYVEALRQAG